MDRLIKARNNRGVQQIVESGVMKFLDFATVQLHTGESHSLHTGDRESVIDIFSGTVTLAISAVGQHEETYSKVGRRSDVFSGPPVMIYVPSNAKVGIKADSATALGVFSAPSVARTPAALIDEKVVTTKQVGHDNWQRTVYSALDQNVAAERLLAGETLNPPGNWSSFPPHKHDRSNPPHEAILEEIYYFRFKPAQGFGFIWTYTALGDPEGFSNVFVVEDRDTVLLPKGYHPVVAAPGYEMHYTWVLAGQERKYGAWADDPRHAWIRNL